MEQNVKPELQVVVIDDDAGMLKNLAAVLDELGYAVQAFSDPIPALKWLEEHGADIVVSDILMPIMNGFEVLRRVKAIDPHCDVIFITAHGERDTALKALKAGAVDFFDKPFDTTALRLAIERTTRLRVLARQRDELRARLTALEQHLPDPAMAGRWPLDTVVFEQVEALLYTEVLRRSRGNVSKAARLLGVSRGKLRRRLGALGMDNGRNGNGSDR
jgi:DNA-binding NtrC family response regulator